VNPQRQEGRKLRYYQPELRKDERTHRSGIGRGCEMRDAQASRRGKWDDGRIGHVKRLEKNRGKHRM